MFDTLPGSQGGVRVIQHIERWSSSPGKVVASLVRPASKVPSNTAEAFMLAVSEGDATSAWQVAAPTVLLLSAPVVVASFTCKLVTGE